MKLGNGALAAGLGFVAGYVDTLGFVALFGLFTAHVTGNFVLIGATLAQSAGNVLLKLLVFPAFIAAVALTRIVVLMLDHRQRVALPPLLMLQSLLLGGFALCGWGATPIHSDHTPLALWAGTLGAAAMGVQNATARLVLPTLTPTTVMTGNVTQLVIDAVDLLRGAGDAALRERSQRFVAPIAAFALGATAGAFGYVALGFASLVLPMALLFGMSALSSDTPLARR
ncbi:MAG: YoaK family protein [Pseudomonadota bacterium]